MFTPPATIADTLRILVAANSALVLLPNGDKEPLLKVHPWPSWLTKGSPKVVDLFVKFFYSGELAEWE